MKDIDIDDIIYITETSITIRESRRRTTVPKEIVDELKLKNNDKLRWFLFEDGKVMLTKVKRKDKD
jgi:bifunctional DNA-binding transcriptional regulator/antitoxin component of YhaV-PrlF toxin-antitoxin module